MEVVAALVVVVVWVVYVFYFRYVHDALEVTEHSRTITYERALMFA